MASRGSPAASVAGPTPLTSIAVLPFIFLSGVEEGKGLSLGFADALITMLGRLEDITVLPTSAILNYAAGTDPPARAAIWGRATSYRETSRSLEPTGASRYSSSMR